MMTIDDAPAVAGVAAALLGLGWAAVSDVTRYEIPNRACGVVALGYLVAGLGAPLGAWLAGLAPGIAILGLGAFLFSRGWLGGGDVKLAAVIALWAGPSRLTDFATVAAIVGVALAAVMLSPLRRRMPAPPEGVAADFRQPMPFGAPLAAGGAWVALLHLVQPPVALLGA
jgi:prepilin peptidase CpaA